MHVGPACQAVMHIELHVRHVRWETSYCSLAPLHPLAPLLGRCSHTDTPTDTWPDANELNQQRMRSSMHVPKTVFNQMHTAVHRKET